jgi:hypothetical protein
VLAGADKNAKMHKPIELSRNIILVEFADALARSVELNQVRAADYRYLRSSRSVHPRLMITVE